MTLTVVLHLLSQHDTNIDNDAAFFLPCECLLGLLAGPSIFSILNKCQSNLSYQ